MKTRCVAVSERSQSTECSTTQVDLWFSRDAEASRRHPVWTPEDIDEPEPWALASFSEFLPYEMV